MDDKETMVSVCCITYNQDKYIRDALESFVNQKTNFKYEVIVHDDASTDNTKKIIREYVEKYPDIIKPIYENENQYSKGIHIMNDIMLPEAKGKYIAICEGDDRWCNENKLQMQYDYMEKHEECSMCVHNTIIHDLLGEKKDELFNENKSHEFATEEAFFDWKVHTSSFFIRREFARVPKEFTKYWFGDFVRLTLESYYGKIYYFDNVMSVYNLNNKNGLSYTYNYNKIIFKNKYSKIIEYLLEYNEFTGNQYKEIIDEKINEIKTGLLLATDVNGYDEFKKVKKQLYKNKYTYKFLTNKKEIIKYKIKMSNYVNYKLFFILKKIIKRG